MTYIYKTVRETTDSYDDDTIKRLQNAYDSIALENKSLRVQISELQASVKALQEANVVLQNTVSGRDILEKIQAKLDKFEPYIDAFTHFQTNDQLIVDKLNAMEKLLLQKGHYDLTRIRQSK